MIVVVSGVLLGETAKSICTLSIPIEIMGLYTPNYLQRFKTVGQHQELRLQEGKSTIGGRYRYIRTLGSAAFSTALECVDLTDEKGKLCA